MKIPKLDKIRFGIGTKEEACSSLWVAFESGSDFYFGTRSQAHRVKVSIHKSRECQLALTSNYWDSLSPDEKQQLGGRKITTWTRQPTPEKGAIQVASLTFPTDFLLLKSKPKNIGKPVFYMAPADAGEAVQFSFFYSVESPESLEARFMRIGKPLFHVALKNEEYVSVIARKIPFSLNAEGNEKGAKVVLPNLKRTVMIGDMKNTEDYTLQLWNSPGEGGVIEIIEIAPARLNIQRQGKADEKV